MYRTSERAFIDEIHVPQEKARARGLKWHVRNEAPESAVETITN